MTDSAQFDEEKLNEVQSVSIDAPVPCERLVGAAGTGKTYELLRRTQEDPSYGLLTSTTGISAVNLGAITIHSTLRYSDTNVLRDIYLSGRLAKILHSIGKRHRRIIVEEYSMADADQLDLWYRGVQEANRYVDTEPIGILLCGDLAQLPPVKGSWCFEANCWPRFAENTSKLEKVWRQDSGPFLDALNLLRMGKGGESAEVLDSAEAHWHSMMDTEFQGTTILPKNDQVNRYNNIGLDRVPGKQFLVPSRRWGEQRAEWGFKQSTKEYGIPQYLQLKVGAYVMVLSNSPDFSVVNGDCGYVKDYRVDHGMHIVDVELVRTGEIASITPIVRHCDRSDEPPGWSGKTVVDDESGKYFAEPHFRKNIRRYVLGQIEYMPLRLAYASTVHKSQSLTLDRVQVDFRNHFFSHPAMMYVALSRCRTLEGLRLVGMKEVFIKHCSMDKRILPWI